MDTWIGAAGAGLLLTWARAAAVLLIAPILCGRALPWWVALPLAAALSFALAPGAPPIAAPGAADLVALLLREAAVGAALGLSARVVFTVFESAGRLVGAAAAAGAGAPDDPDAASPLALLFFAVGVGVFLLTGGHRALVLAIDGSFATCAVGSWEGAAAGADAAIALFSGAFAGAVMIAAPAFAAALAVDGVAALVARLAPGAGLQEGAPLLRAVCVQLVAVAALAFAVQAGVDLLGAGLARAAGVS